MQIKLELTGEFAYRFVTKGGEPKPPAPLPAPTNGIIALPVPSDLKIEDSEIEIYDNTRGNMARVPVNIKTQANLTETLFKYVQVVTIPVQSRGKAVTDVQVSLKNADKTYGKTVMLRQADNGTARFENVPLDEPITVTVSYASNKPTSITEALSRAHQADGHHRAPLNVDWADVKTLATPANTGVPISPSATPSTGQMSAPTSQPVPAPTGGNGLLNTLIGIAFVGGVGYYVYRMYEQGKIKTMLEKAGIQTEQPENTAPVGNPFAKPELPPIQPITEGTVDPFAGGGLGSPLGGMTTAPVSQAPRLVGTMGTYSGSVFPLNASTLMMGRDPSNPIALPNDNNASRQHALVQMQNGQYSVTDNGSSNGTLVNGVKIQSGVPHPLQPGDEIQVGMTRFRLEA